MIDPQTMHATIPIIEQPGPSVEEQDRALRTLAGLAAKHCVTVPELLELGRMLGLLPDKL